MFPAILDAFRGRRHKHQPAQEPVTSAPAEAVPAPPDHPAAFVGADGPVIVMLGTFILYSDVDSAVEDGFGGMHEIPTGYAEVAEYLLVPRTAGQLATYCARNGLDSGVLEELESAGVLLRVDTSSATRAAACFAGVGVIPKSAPGVEGTLTAGAPVPVYGGGVRPNMHVTPSLAAVLWGDDAFNLDIPTAIARVCQDGRQTFTAARVLKDIPQMLELNLACLMPTSPRYQPNAAATLRRI